MRKELREALDEVAEVFAEAMTKIGAAMHKVFEIDEDIPDDELGEFILEYEKIFTEALGEVGMSNEGVEKVLETVYEDCGVEELDTEVIQFPNS